MSDLDLYQIPFLIEEGSEGKFFIKFKLSEEWEPFYRIADKLADLHRVKAFYFTYDSPKLAKQDLKRFIVLSQTPLPKPPYKETGVLGEILITEQ